MNARRWCTAAVMFALGASVMMAPAEAAPAETVASAVASGAKSKISVVLTGAGGSSLKDVGTGFELRLQRRTARGWTTLGKLAHSDPVVQHGFWFRSSRDGTFRVRATPTGGAYRTSFSRPFRVRVAQPSSTRVTMRRGSAITATVIGDEQGPASGRSLELWRKKAKKWVRISRVRADLSPYVFPANPGRYRVGYDQRNGHMWAPNSKPVTIEGRKQVADVTLRRRHSKTISGSLVRDGFAGHVAVAADVRRGGRWVPVRHRAIAFEGDTYTLPVPGARPKARVRVMGGMYSPHPTIFWNGSVRGVLSARKAEPIDLAAGSVAGVGFTIPAFEEFTRVESVRVKGRERVGSTLVAQGAWAPSPTRVRYQWQSGRVWVKGATQRTYRVRKADRGRKLSVRIEIERGWYRPQILQTKRVLVK